MGCEGPGSSPLTRGKLPSVKDITEAYGLIPAHAGKTRLEPHLRKTSTAHPRSRGENTMNRILGEDIYGSSPLTRGKPAMVALSAAHAGLIPAHAGKTIFVALYQNNETGSSPLTRGKLRV